MTAFERLRSLANQAAAGDPIGIAAKGNSLEKPPEPTHELAQASKILWDAIRVRSVVLAQEDDEEDGWWEAVVLAVHNGHCTLCWRDYPEQGLFRRKRDQLALLRPTI